jgi:hypothetical protein
VDLLIEVGRARVLCPRFCGIEADVAGTKDRFSQVQQRRVHGEQAQPGAGKGEGRDAAELTAEVRMAGRTELRVEPAWRGVHREDLVLHR